MNVIFMGIVNFEKTSFDWFWSYYT